MSKTKRTICQRFWDLITGRRVQQVVIVGEPGIDKSRLV